MLGMNELSLFSGAGGGCLGSLLLGHKIIGYVEINEYCQKIIAQRIRDRILSDAPIFGDIQAFIDSGSAKLYRGATDIISAGFPCQPFSLAGSRQGAGDPRNLWPATLQVVQIIRPRYAFLENVPGLLVSGYFGRILSDLAESGYDARWCVLGASDCGAPHIRKRLWILADTISERWGGRYHGDGEEGEIQAERSSRYSESEVLANSYSQRFKKQREQKSNGKEHVGAQLSSWWEVEPRVGRVADGLANRVDRLSALGNGQVPIVAATAWKYLNDGLLQSFYLKGIQKRIE